MTKTQAELRLENERLVAEHNRHRKRLGYTFMRTEWTPDSVGAKTIEEDTRLAIVNKIYSKSKDAQEANWALKAYKHRIEELVTIGDTKWVIG